MSALDRFVAWMAGYAFVDRHMKLPPGLQLQYHSRSDAHSQKLGELIVDDLIATCPALREQAARGHIAFGVNHVFVWPNGKAKTLDLAIGIPLVPRSAPLGVPIHRLRSQTRPRKTPEETLARLFIACEEKAVMTEHGKSQPRLYSELNDAHTIVHQGSRDTIAAAIATVNIASSFVSPLRQARDRAVEISLHSQPDVAANMVQHLRRLPIRHSLDGVGLDAYCTFVVDADNQGHVSLHTAPPAPQIGDSDHYDTFLARMCELYTERYSDPGQLPPASGLTIEETLLGLAQQHPGLLEATGERMVQEGVGGAMELYAILEAIEHQANPAPDEEKIYL